MNKINNYSIIEIIYESTKTLVYRAKNKEHNQSVIIKVMKSNYPSAEELASYHQEYDPPYFL